MFATNSRINQGQISVCSCERVWRERQRQRKKTWQNANDW